MWLYESDLDAPSTSSEPGGKQWEWEVNIGLDNGLVLSGNKPLPVAWQHQAITWANVDQDLCTICHH